MRKVLYIFRISYLILTYHELCGLGFRQLANGNIVHIKGETIEINPYEKPSKWLVAKYSYTFYHKDSNRSAQSFELQTNWSV